MEASKIQFLSIRAARLLAAEDRAKMVRFVFAALDPQAREQRTEQTLRAFERNRLDADLWLTCWRGRRLVGCLVCETHPGRVASFWPIRMVAGPHRALVQQRLLHEGIELVESRGAKFVQAMLPPDDAEGSIALRKHSFRAIARICTMHCPLPASLALPENQLKLVAPTPSNARECRDLLYSTYAGSLDCPEVNTIRTAEEVFASSRAADPARTHWSMAFWGEEPVGIVIVHDGPSARTAHLTYLGVAPAARRRGFGRQMLSMALRQAIERGGNGMTLVVDERNQPAIHLYREFGFRETSVDRLYLRVF